MKMHKIQELNKVIKDVINIWKKLSFSRLHSICDKGNKIIFSLYTLDQNSSKFIEKLREITYKKHPIGDINFVGYSQLTDSKLDVSSNVTFIRKYNLTIFSDTNMNDDEFLDKLKIFYNKLLDTLKNLSNKQ